MKTRFLTIIGISLCLSFASVFAIITFSDINADALRMRMSTDDVLETFDLIILGTVTDVHTSENSRYEFVVAIEDTIKKPDSEIQKNSSLVLVCEINPMHMGSGCPSFEVGERGLFLALLDNDTYMVSSYSKTSEANCTSEQFLESYSGDSHSFYWLQNGQSNEFFINQPIEIFSVIHNRDLQELNYSQIFHSSTLDFFFTDTVSGTIDECVGFKTISTSFVPTTMGMYGFGLSDGSSSSFSSGTAVIDPLTSPLKQYKTKISSQDTWCKDDLYLILKNDDTKPRFDNFPACVSLSTIQELVKRNWGYIPPESDVSELLDN